MLSLPESYPFPRPGKRGSRAATTPLPDRHHRKRINPTMAVATPIPARMRGLNRAEICDVNFQEFVRDWDGPVGGAPGSGESILPGSALDAEGLDRKSTRLNSSH